MLAIIIARGAAVRVGGGGRRVPPGTEVDEGLPLNHPAVLIPLIGLILIFVGAAVTCFCKLAPNLVPENLRIFGKRSVPANENVEFQLGRRNPRRPSSSSEVDGTSNGRTQRSSSADPRSSPRNPSSSDLRGHSHSPHLSPRLYLPNPSSRNQATTFPSTNSSSSPGNEMTHWKKSPLTPPPTYERVQEFPHLYVPVVTSGNPLNNV